MASDDASRTVLPIPDYDTPAAGGFTGRLHPVPLGTDPAEDNDHLISADERLRVAMAIQ